MSLKCRVCGKELPEFDQRGFRNAGFTAHQNRCIERERERREGITRRPQRAHTTHGRRRLLPASSSSSPPPFIDYYWRSSQRRRRHSAILDVVSLQQSSAPASFISSPPPFPSQPLDPSTFLNFSTVSPEQQQQQHQQQKQGQSTLQSQPPPPPLFSSFPISHHPDYYEYHSYCSQPAPSSIIVSSSVPTGVAARSTYPSPISYSTTGQITGSSFLHPVDHDPIQQNQSSPFVSSSTPLLPSQPQMQPSSMVNYMNPVLPQEAKEEKSPSNYTSLPTAPGLQFYGVEQESSIITTPEKLQIELFPVQHCNYCIPNAGLHDPNCYLLLQFVTGATTRAPQGPSSSAY